MKLAIFDEHRLGLVVDDGHIVDVTEALPAHDADPVGAGWWVRLCRDFDELRPALEAVARRGTPRPLSEVVLRAPVLNPSKVIAAEHNYGVARRAAAGDLSEDMAVLVRTIPAERLYFRIFLESPSAITGPGEPICIPESIAEQGVHTTFGCELAVVIGEGGRHIAEGDALQHVFGYAAALDCTHYIVGSDPSYMKSFDSLTPIGPWISTRDEIPDPQSLAVSVRIDGVETQKFSTGEMERPVAAIVAFASESMTLNPGDVIITGSYTVNIVTDGSTVTTSIDGVGTMENSVRLVAASASRSQPTPAR
jgi:2-keto-4-pentenoate hydratase/2-oxohepta-3-ene-1,7-dioic acid hydratase in catechol pathway